MKSLVRDLLVALTSCLVLGCDASTESKLGRPIDAPPPRHPAMGAESVARTAPERGAQSGALPAGHPPVGAGAGATSTAPAASAPAAGEATAGALPDRGRVQIGAVSFEIPEGLVREQPSSGMRLGQLRLPRAEGDSEDGVLTVIEAGGSVDDNLSRWRGQFTGSPAAETDTFEKGRLTVTTIRVEGAFQGMGGPMAGGGGPAKENYRLSGAVVRDPQRQSLTFLKATGPRATLLRWEDALESLFRSIEAE